MNSFQAVCLFWWLVLGATGHACWCASAYRVGYGFQICFWNFWTWLPLAAIGGLFTLGAVACFEDA